METINRTNGAKKKLKNLVKRGEFWYFKKMVGGKVSFQTLDTGDLTLAKARRDDLAKKALAAKWSEIDEMKTKRDLATIGEVLVRYAAAKDLQLAARTYEDNAWALKHVVKRVKGLDEVDKLPCSVLDGNLVREWQRLCLAAAGEDKLKLDSAAVSANSVLAQARSVFSKATRSRNVYAGMKLPDLKEFLETPRLEELRRDDYQKPALDLLHLVFEAATVLRDGRPAEGKSPAVAKRPGLYLLFLLASEAGLRRGEVVAMRWRWFGPGVIRTMFETDFVPKGQRERSVPVRESLERQCRAVAKAAEWKAEPTDYVLPGTVWQKESLFREFGEWMKDLGWTRRQKAHELRKVFASDFLEGATPYDAQLALGHRDLKTTARYAARRRVAGVDQATRYEAKPAVTEGADWEI